MSTEENNQNILLEELNPYGSLVAVVEQDERTAYLYLNPVTEGGGEQSPRAIWLRNLQKAPDDTDRDGMQAGFAPLFKKSACNHPEGAEPLSKDDLDLVWFQEGNGVALFIDGKPEAIIPPWSGRDGLFGYSREALDQDVGTLPLRVQESPGLIARVQENLDFWTARTQKDFWETFRDERIAYYEALLGQHKQYFAVTDRPYPPLGILEFEKDGVFHYITLGMSNQNLPNVEMYMEDPEKHMRIELYTQSPAQFEWLPGLLGRMAGFPWLNMSWYGSGHLYESGLGHETSDFILTNDLSGTPLAEGAPLESDGYPVSILRALPISGEWIAVARVRGADHVIKKILEQQQS